VASVARRLHRGHAQSYRPFSELALRLEEMALNDEYFIERKL
jgi:hypothetical protein